MLQAADEEATRRKVQEILSKSAASRAHGSSLSKPTAADRLRRVVERARLSGASSSGLPGEFAWVSRVQLSRALCML